MNAQQLGLQAERKRLGYAKVKLADLTFPDKVRNGITRPLESKNVIRLERVFELEGVLRLLPEHYIAGLTPAGIGQSRLSQTRGDQALEILDLGPDIKIRCLYGRHRIEAAKRVLAHDDRWWIVELYTGTPISSLTEQSR